MWTGWVQSFKQSAGWFQARLKITLAGEAEVTKHVPLEVDNLSNGHIIKGEDTVTATAGAVPEPKYWRIQQIKKTTNQEERGRI